MRGKPHRMKKIKTAIWDMITRKDLISDIFPRANIKDRTFKNMVLRIQEVEAIRYR